MCGAGGERIITVATEVVGAMEKLAGVVAVIVTGVVATERSLRVFCARSRGGWGRDEISLTVVIGNLGSKKGIGDMKKPGGFISTFCEVLAVPYSAFRAVQYTF